jgi:hypothetical protein
MDDNFDIKNKTLDELMEFAKLGMAKEMRARHGRPMDDQEPPPGPPDDPSQDEDIPGVEPDEGQAEADMEGEGDQGKSKIDPEMLKQLLAKMKSKQG